MKFKCEDLARAALGEPAKREAAELVYRCPHPEAHKNGDSHPSLKINPKKDVWLCGPCRAKGKAWALAAFIAGIDAGDKEKVTAWLVERGLLAKGERKGKAKSGRGACVATYLYTDAQGKPVARKLRFEPGENGKKKSFAWERWEGGKWIPGLGSVKTPLYRIAKIISSPFVVLPEGEKDADAGASIGLATATSGGVGSWREDHAECLRGKEIIVIADADGPGRAHAQRVAALLYGTAASVAVTEIPSFHDLADAIAGGMSCDAILAHLLSAPEWKPASGAEILDMVMAFVRRFVSMTAHQARGVALWTAHTHAFDAADCTPYLAVNSAEKQSGKTRLLEVLRLLVSNPWFTGRVTADLLKRKIDTESPALLLDEGDAAFRGPEEYSEALRGVLNTGYRRGGVASCCVGQGTNITYKDFSTFCPKAIAGIGKLPDTVADRSLPINLKRARRGAVARFREREAQHEASDIAARLASWCAANLEALRKARPEIPPQLSDRQADCCEPLLAIADLAGGEWPETARAALVALCGQAQAEDDSLGVRLLQDIRAIFEEKEVGELPSGELCDALARIETSPWGEWSHGKPLTPARLARMLSPFGIVPDRMGGRDSRTRGYRLSQFEDAFSRYLAFESVHPSTTRENSGGNEDLKASTKGVVDTWEKAVSSNKDAGGGHVDTLKAVYGEAREGASAIQPVLIHKGREVLEL
jgi:hypothetical protein